MAIFEKLHEKEIFSNITVISYNFYTELFSNTFAELFK